MFVFTSSSCLETLHLESTATRTHNEFVNARDIECQIFNPVNSSSNYLTVLVLDIQYGRSIGQVCLALHHSRWFLNNWHLLNQQQPALLIQTL